MEQYFTHKEKRQSKIHFNSGYQSPRAKGSLLPADTGHLAHMHPSHASTDGFYRLLSENRHSIGVSQVLYDARTQQNKRTYLGLTTEKDLPMQNDKLGTGCVSSFCQAQGPSWRGWIGVERLMHQTAFLNMEHEYLTIACHGPPVSPLSRATVSLMLFNFIRSEKYFQIIQNQYRYPIFKFLLLWKLQSHRPVWQLKGKILLLFWILFRMI